MKCIVSKSNVTSSFISLYEFSLKYICIDEFSFIKFSNLFKYCKKKLLIISLFIKLLFVENLFKLIFSFNLFLSNIYFLKKELVYSL